MADNSTKSTTGGPVRVRRARLNAESVLGGGVVFLGAEDFAQIEECTSNPKGPNESMLAAAARYDALLSRR